MTRRIRSLLKLILLSTSLTVLVTVNAQSNFPGGFIDLKLEKINDQLPEIKFGLREPVIIDQQNHWRILVGLDLTLLPGEYVLYYKHADDDKSGEYKTIEVLQKVYPFQDVQKDQRNDVVDYYTPVRISAIDFSNTQQPLLPLQPPLNGSWNRQFGYQWIVEGANEVITSNAISIRAGQYSSVLAPQNAIVSNIVMDEQDRAAVILDHGRGLYSILRGLTDLTIDIGNGVVAGAVLGRLPAQADLEQSKLVWQTLLNGVFIDPSLLSNMQQANDDVE